MVTGLMIYMIDDLLEIFYYILLLLFGIFIEYKVLPALSKNPKKDNPFYNRLKFVEFIILIRILYLFYMFVSKYIFL